VLSVMQRFLLVVFGFVKKISLINIYVEILFINLLLSGKERMEYLSIIANNPKILGSNMEICHQNYCFIFFPSFTLNHSGSKIAEIEKSDNLKHK